MKIGELTDEKTLQKETLSKRYLYFVCSLAFKVSTTLSQPSRNNGRKRTLHISFKYLQMGLLVSASLLS